MVIGLGCEKLQPERLLTGTDDVRRYLRGKAPALSVCRMKSDAWFLSMVEDSFAGS